MHQLRHALLALMGDPDDWQFSHGVCRP